MTKPKRSLTTHIGATFASLTQETTPVSGSTRSLIVRDEVACRRILRSKRTEHGFFTIWMLGLCVGLLGIGGISVDLWRGFADRRELAAITDAAAIAGASQLDLAKFKANSKVTEIDPIAARRVAAAYLDEQARISGFTYTRSNITIANGEVQISASRTLDLTLLGLLQPGETVEISVDSSATPELAQ